MSSKNRYFFLKYSIKESEIYNGTMKLNDTIKINDKYLGFYDIKYWSNFYIVKDYGTTFVYAGIGLIIFMFNYIIFYGS